MAQAQSAYIAVGREVEFYNRVLTNDGANAALRMLLLQTGGDDLADLVAYETVADMLAGPSNELSVAGYGRKTLTDADLDPWFAGSAGTALFLPLQTFAALTAGQTIDHVVVAYDPNTATSTDADRIPVTIAEARIDGVAIPTLGDDVIVDYSGSDSGEWLIARSQATGSA